MDFLFLIIPVENHTLYKEHLVRMTNQVRSFQEVLKEISNRIQDVF